MSKSKELIVYTIAETARLIGVQRQTIYSWIEKARRENESTKDPSSILYYLVNAESNVKDSEGRNKTSYMLRVEFVANKIMEKEKISKELEDEASTAYYSLYELIEERIEESENKATELKKLGNMTYIDGEISKYIYEYILNGDFKKELSIEKESPIYNLQLSKIRSAISQMRFTNKNLIEVSVCAMNSFITLLKKGKENEK